MPTLKDLRDERSRLLAKGLTLSKKADDTDGDGDGATLSAEDAAALRDIATKIEALDSDIAEVEDGEKALAFIRGKDSGGAGAFEKAGSAPVARTLGDHFVKSAGDRLGALSEGRGTVSVPEFSGVKAASDPTKVPTAAGWDGFLTDYDRAVVNARRERLVVADLMGSGTIAGAHLSYLVEASPRFEGGFGTVAEGAQKPDIRYIEPTIVNESLTKIAGVTKITDEMYQDLPFLVSTINANLLFDLSVFEEDQLLNGDGNGTNLTGLRNRSGIQKMVLTDAADNVEAPFRAKNAIRNVTPLDADALVINPADYEAFRLMKDGNGQYVAGGPFQGQYGNGTMLTEPPLWGLRTVVSAAVPAGTAIVGAFGQASTVYRKGGVRVESTNTDRDDFVKNLVTVRAEERIGLAVRRPAAFVEITFAGGDAVNP